MNKEDHPNPFSVAISSLSSFSQQGDPKATEVWSPVPKIVTPGSSNSDAPSDAIILFDGKNLDQWVHTKDTTMGARWTVAEGIITVKKGTGNIQTKRSFTDYQLHIEWRIPANITGSDRPVAIAVFFLPVPGPEMKDMRYRYWIVIIIQLM